MINITTKLTSELAQLPCISNFKSLLFKIVHFNFVKLFLIFAVLNIGEIYADNNNIYNNKVKESSINNPEIKSQCLMLLHGFGGSPHDLKPLTNVLDTLNVSYFTVLLAGHGTHPRDLKNIQYKTWISDCFDIYDSLSNEFESVALIGFSMGGAISQIISAERDVSKLVVLSPYYRIHQKWYYFGKPEKWAKRFSIVMPYIKKLKIGQINDPSGLEKYSAYEKLPLRAVGELVKVGNLAIEEAKNVSCPVLWLHSKGDIVSDYNLSFDAFNNNESSDKAFISFTRSNHILLYDYDSDEVIQRILRFLHEE